MNPFRSYLQGFRTGKAKMLELADLASDPTIPAGLRPEKYGRAAIKDPEFYAGLKREGVTAKETPMQFAGAATARMMGDVVADESRSLYWRYNHPLAIADKLLQKGIDPDDVLGPYGRGVVGLAAIQPAIALTGAYNPLNISELGRPTGYKQNVPDPEDPTKSLEPGTELFQRFFQGRTGRPLAFEKAQQEIPGLTKGRYANYMNFLYNDPGPIGRATLGIVKATPENLQGVPEARVFGYPISIPSATALAGGLAGAKTGISMGRSPSVETKGTRTSAALRGLAGGAIGSAAGAVVGVLANQAIAAAGNSMNKLPTQTEYQNISAGRI
jgi:hypothetical protein